MASAVVNIGSSGTITDLVSVPNSAATARNVDSSGFIPSKKNLKQMTSIEQAKERAQITANTSMSIVHIALLKDVLDGGPQSNPYYHWSLGFILTALILQILAGFISLYIALLRYYYTEYKDDFLDDCGNICCPWGCNRIKNNYESVNAWLKQQKPHHNNTSTEAYALVSNTDTCDDKPGCCPYKFSFKRYDNFECQVLDLYDVASEEKVRGELENANFDIELRWLTQSINTLKVQLEENKSTDVNDKVANEEYCKAINDQLKEAITKKKAVEARVRQINEVEAQSTILEKHVSQIQEERILKRTTFFQNWLNMMMYVVFVLNMCIAGIGLSNPQTIVVTPASNVTSV